MTFCVYSHPVKAAVESVPGRTWYSRSHPCLMCGMPNDLKDPDHDPRCMYWTPPEIKETEFRPFEPKIPLVVFGELHHTRDIK